MEKLGLYWKGFHEICRIFRKSVQKIKVLMKYHKNNSGTVHEDIPIYIYIYVYIYMYIYDNVAEFFLE